MLEAESLKRLRDIHCIVWLVVPMHQAVGTQENGRGNGTRLTARNRPILQGGRQKAGAGFVVQGYDGLLGCHSEARPREGLLDVKPVKGGHSSTEDSDKGPSGSPGDMHDCEGGRKRRGSRRKAGEWFLNGFLETECERED